MPNNLPQRKTIRLPGYDYTAFGYYFITICVQNREMYFENNDVKQITEYYWRQIPNHFQNTKLDEFIIMPNHLHGIIIIRRGGVTPPATNGSGNPTPTLGQIIGYFKYQSTKQINIVLKNPPGQKLWQRNYYEHIIRNDESLNRIREYIQTNPENWNTDRNNPRNFKNKNLATAGG